MNEPVTTEDSDRSSGLRAALALAALGVVLGDIGTSPLYALRECLAEPVAGESFRAEILGILSLILWTLIAVVSVKYAWLILKADNDGEGGILALTSLVGKVTGRTDEEGPKITWLLVLGIGGMALFLADGMITPAISVLGALEGIQVAAPGFHHVTVPLTLGILVSLFAAQRVGTASIGVCFGPIILCWFVAMGLLGIRGIWGHPEVFAALNPLHGISYLWEHGGASFKVLGAVLLVATGAEALYADLGHFGARSIRIAWFGVALPCLVLNYFGQGALVLTNPPAAVNPFYLLAPPALVVPLIMLAAAATVIASQAVITGAFSLARQAVMLGLTPRLEIRHTSASHIGQVYVPFVNWFLMIGTGALVVGFGSSARLASAYGLAVALTMLITVALATLYFRQGLGWSRSRCWLVVGALTVIDLAFVGAAFTKLFSGGWMPLAMGGTIAFVLVTWIRGQALLRRRADDVGMSEEEFLTSLARNPPARVRGTAIMVTRLPSGIPRTLLHLLKHTKSMHEMMVLLTVEVAPRPRVPDSGRVQVRRFRDDFIRVSATYGFMETPDIPGLLRDAHRRGLLPELRDCTYLVGRLTLLPAAKPRLRWFARGLFFFLFHNSHEVTRHFGIPPNRTIEIGTPVEL